MKLILIIKKNYLWFIAVLLIPLWGWILFGDTSEKEPIIISKNNFSWENIKPLPPIKTDFANYKIIPPAYLDQNLQNQSLLGVMIENSVPSRFGMKGLSSAKIVYETLAEGGITRFLALFTKENKNIIIGPIRSVRDYYLDWAEEYNLTLLHCGGSDTVMGRLSTAKIENVDEFNDFYAEHYFFRDKKLVRPHNLFSNTNYFFDLSNANLPDKKALDLNNLPINNKKIVFVGEEFSLSLPNKGVKIDFFDDDYEVEYVYDQTLGVYKRLNGGIPHIDNENNKVIIVNNIIIQKTSSQVMDEKLHLNIDTKSSGDCVFFTKGTYDSCKWQFIEGQTKFLNLKGEELKFNRGNLWIEVVNVVSPISIY